MRHGVPSWLSTYYDESEWNNCFIICSIFSYFFVFSGVAFLRRATISASVGSANLATILNFTTHRILAEILVVKEPIRELHCHYLVTCVYNNHYYYYNDIYYFLSNFWQITTDIRTTTYSVLDKHIIYIY